MRFLFPILALTLSLTAFCSNAQSRSIRGTVYHAISGRYLPGIVVQAAGSDVASISNATGEYAITLPDSIRVVNFTGFTGMNLIEVRTVSNDVFDIYISEVEFINLSLNELMNVKVTTASKTPENISETPASVVIITQADIRTYGYQRLEDILEHIAGLYMIDDYYWLGSVNYGVRGFFTNEPFNNIILMVNDVNQMEEYSRGAPLTKVGVPVEAIHHIEVIRGPMSVLYGSGAFMGAINIITSENTQTEVSATAGSWETKKLFMRYFDSLGVRNSFSLTGSLYQTNGPDIPYSDLTSNPTGSNGKTYLEMNGLRNDATTHDQLSETRLYVNTHYKSEHFTFDGTYTTNTCGMFDGQPAVGTGNAYINTSITLLGQIDRKLSDEIAVRIKETYSSYSDRINYEQDYANSNTGSNQLSSFIESEANAFYTPSPAVNILLGLYNRYVTQYEWQGYYTIAFGPNYLNFISTIERPSMVSALFLQATYNAGDKLNVVAGCRVEQSTPFDIRRVNDIDTTSIVKTYTYDYSAASVLPRLALIYAADKNHILKFMYGTAIKQPSMASLQPYTLHPNWPMLKPSTISTYEINYLGHSNRYVTMNLSVFYNDIKNLIARKDMTAPDGTIIISSTNSGQMNSIGVEAGIHVQPTNSITIDISGTYQHSQDKSSGMDTIDLGYSPSFLGYGTLAYTIGTHITLGLSYRYVDNMVSYYENTSDFRGRIGAASPAYSVFDVNIAVTEITKNVFANLKINNVFDTEIRYPTTLAGSIWDKGTVGRPRMLYFSIGYNF